MEIGKNEINSNTYTYFINKGSSWYDMLLLGFLHPWIKPSAIPLL